MRCTKTLDMNAVMPEVRLFHSREGRQLFVTKMCGSYKPLFAHEATHAALRYVEAIGDGDQWGEEDLAYLVQYVTYALTVAQMDWLSRHKERK